MLVHHDFDGLAFALTDNDPFVCIDLDNCIKDKQLSLFSKSIVKTFEGTYMELSGSLEGIHIFMKGNIANNLNQQTKGIEIYKSNRCIAMTAELNSKHFKASHEVLDFQLELHKLYAQLILRQPKIKNLSSNNHNASALDLPNIQYIIDTMCKVNYKARDYFKGINGSGDWSKDDFNFLLLLRSFTHGNAQAMETIFLESALSRLNDKSKRRNDEAYLKYLRGSIQKVNQIGHSNFWNYNYKQLTQNEVSR